MDLMALLRYVFDHNQQVIGGLMVIILATAALLAMRMVAQEKTAPAGGGGTVKADVDLGAIEAAFKRVMAAQTGVPAAAAASPESHAAAGADTAKMQELAREIDRLTAELNSKSDGAGFGGTSAPQAASGDSSQLEALNAKIAELEGKLTEYEIIEDDIADLSRYKEENAELRSELESLKSRATAAPVVNEPGDPLAEALAAEIATIKEEPSVTPGEIDPIAEMLASVEAQKAANAAPAETAAPAAAAPAQAAAAVATGAQASPAAAAPPTAAPPTAAAAGAKASPAQAAAKADLDEATLKDFASEVEIQKPAVDVGASSDLNFAVAAAALADGSSILDDSVDTDKMIEEVSSLSQSTETAEDVLGAALDTDKLLAEVGSLTPSATPAQAPAAATQPEAKLEDDLLAEFKDSNDGGQG